MEMTGKELPTYRFDKAPTVDERIIALGMVDGEQCSLSLVCDDGDHYLVATVNGKRAAISGRELLGATASLREVPHV